MKVKLIGIQNFDKMKMRDGEVIDGVKLHMSYPKDKVTGSFVDSKFVGRSVFESFGYTVEEVSANVETEVNIEFDGNKKVVGLVL